MTVAARRVLKVRFRPEAVGVECPNVAGDANDRPWRKAAAARRNRQRGN
jgi:hypothetical protein